jgi:hypothetical protein
MRATGSTPTATPWRWSERASRARAVAGRLVALLALAALAGCVSSQTRYYVPTEGQPRLGTNDVKDQAEVMLRAECPRLLQGAPSALGEAHLVVDVDGGGKVARARIAKSSGDERVDAMFAGLLAQLEVDAPESGKARSSRVRMGYSCSPEQAVVTVRGIDMGDGDT